MSGNGWIGVDLDGTLAHYDKWRGSAHVGEPVPAMLERVKQLLAYGIEVRIFTARADDPDALPAINAWCLKHIGVPLQVTNVKDYSMVALYDDRAIAVERNTGRLLGGDERW